MEKLLFTVNDYDKYGDLIEEAIHIHFGDTRIKIGDSLEDFDSLIEQLLGMREEIKETL